MTSSDKKLGMDRDISRRDIVHGLGALGASMAFPLSGCSEQSSEIPTSTSPYPPSLTGMRGNHDGAFEVAHALGREGKTDWGPITDLQEETYDLVVVGGGISGLAAAHFYRKEKPDARILILDNHDDFGGHAKRNEFEVDGKTIIGFGGSQTLQEPSSYPKAAKTLLSDLGINLERFYESYDQDFFKKHGLRGGFQFNKEAWGQDITVPTNTGMFEDYVPVAETEMSIADSIDLFPISGSAKNELLTLSAPGKDLMPEIPIDKKWDYLRTISYKDFLIKHAGITEPEVFKFFDLLGADYGLGINLIPTSNAFSFLGFPGWEAAGLPDYDEEVEPYIHHFPDGNASVSRLIIRSLIPDVAKSSTMEDIVTAKFDYAKLDMTNAPARMRLNSTVVNVEHEGDIKNAETVNVSYVRDNKSYRVTTRHCIMACFNSLISQICPDLPKQQKEPLSNQVRSPILYTNVLLRNWKAWKQKGIGAVYCPGSYHVHAMLDFPVSMGSYRFSANPDEPVIVRMERFPYVNDESLSDKDQYRAGRYELLSTPFEEIERQIRIQLNGLLGDADFDAAEDIVGITVNRWAHGYAYNYNSLIDEMYDNRDDPRYPHVQARQQFGRISIANSDSAARPMLEAAVEQGYRAAMEQLAL